MAPRTESSSNLLGQHTMSRVMSESDMSANEGVNHRDYTVKRSKLIGLINWSHVIGTFAPHAFILALAASAGQLIYNYALNGGNPVREEVRGEDERGRWDEGKVLRTL